MTMSEIRFPSGRRLWTGRGRCAVSSSAQFCGRGRLPYPCRPESHKRNTCEPASVSCSPCRSILPCRQVHRVTNIYVLSFCVPSYIFGFLRGDEPRIFYALTYFCCLLRGLSGIVIFSCPEAKSGLRYFVLRFFRSDSLRYSSNSSIHRHVNTR